MEIQLAIPLLIICLVLIAGENGIKAAMLLWIDLQLHQQMEKTPYREVVNELELQTLRAWTP
jgi:hypothetical protein